MFGVINMYAQAIIPQLRAIPPLYSADNEKEIQKTADEYFARFANQDEAKRKLLEQGKITEEEYKSIVEEEATVGGEGPE